ncbi:unnamed protein product [Mytilus coruscus]|uniref:DZIP3-like HEPN domain-containing protein n=1 Tax=Mytilus coruscus TaxID=42192 RepID=A0A6J8ET64_MYTCO|nr:unnamed protein product [Mytilus coruscus]
MSDIFKDRHAKLGCMVLRLFPEVMQLILKEYATPNGVNRKYSQKDFHFVFKENEVVLMDKLPNMDDFTIEICYKILRFENMLDEPKCKWGNAPHDTEVEIADDIQRLINATNSIISINIEAVTENYSEKLLVEIKSIVTRTDSYFEQDTLESIDLYLQCIPVLYTFYPEHQTNLKELQYSNTNNSLDVTLIYKLLRQFNLIPTPAQGWGAIPDKADTKLGDDIERIRRHRNEIAHRCDTNIDTTVFDDFFAKFRDIGHRLDFYFFQKTNYEQRMIDHKTCRMDTEMQAKYENAMKDIEKIQCRQKVRVQIIFQNQDDVDRNITILNSLKEEINEGLSGIEFIVATKGSIVLNVDILLEMMDTDEKLQTTQTLFLEKITERITTFTSETMDIVLFPVEEYTKWNVSKTIGEPVYLDFDIEAELFETDNKLEQQLGKISDVITKHSNGSGKKNNTTATLLPISLDGTDIHHVSLPYPPHFITKVDSDTVAVSCTDIGIILIINISIGSVTSTITTKFKSKTIGGIAVDTRDLPYGISYYDDNNLNKLVWIDGTSVGCCSLDGKLIWRFLHMKYRYAFHMTIDDDGNVYFTDEQTYTVVVVADDGKHFKEILTKSDGLNEPRGIYFDIKENSLLVCNQDGKAFLFDVKKKHN